LLLFFRKEGLACLVKKNQRSFMSGVMRLAALFAVLFQLVVAQPMMAAAPEMHVCRVADHPAAPHHHDMDCLRCPLCAAVVQAALMPAQCVLRVPSVVFEAIRGNRPQARAPPGRVLLAAYPRGPPSLA
jgi:hypothetical protein